MILTWLLQQPHTFWETIPVYWHNWPLPFFKHFPRLLWYNIFVFWFGGFSESVVLPFLLSLLSISMRPPPAPQLCPSPSPAAACPRKPIHFQYSNSGRWFSILLFWCQLPGESHRAARSDFGTVMSYSLGLRQSPEAGDIDPGAPSPHHLAHQIAMLCSFLIKPVQEKSWSFYTVRLIC